MLKRIKPFIQNCTTTLSRVTFGRMAICKLAPSRINLITAHIKIFQNLSFNVILNMLSNIDALSVILLSDILLSVILISVIQLS